MAMSAPKGDSSAPMVEMNTTPLIDVMLVLLIMFIITLPPPTHSVKIDLPVDCRPNCPPPPPVDPVKNVIYISPQSQIMWNTTPIDQATLVENLKQVLALQNSPAGEPETVFGPDPEAPYDTVDKVMAFIKNSKVTRFGFSGNENYGGMF